MAKQVQFQPIEITREVQIQSTDEEKGNWYYYQVGPYTVYGRLWSWQICDKSGVKPFWADFGYNTRREAIEHINKYAERIQSRVNDFF